MANNSRLNDYSKDLSQESNEMFLSCTRNKEILMYRNKGKHVETFNREQKLKEKVNSIPAPNRYDINQELYQRKQKISFPRSSSSVIYFKEQNPGPGAYNITNVLHKKNKNYIFGKGARSIASIQEEQQLFQKLNTVDNQPTEQKNKSVQSTDVSSMSRKVIQTFGSAPKYPKEKKILAGPGDYNVYNPERQPLPASMKKKYQSNIQLEQNILQPGPGSYDLRLPVISSTGSIGKSKRQQQKIPKYPGPGNYEPKPSQFDKKYDFKIIEKIVKQE